MMRNAKLWTCFNASARILTGHMSEHKETSTCQVVENKGQVTHGQ